MSLDFFFCPIIFSHFIFTYQHGKVDWLALCKCFLIENNITTYCDQFHTNNLEQAFTLEANNPSDNVTLSIN